MIFLRFVYLYVFFILLFWVWRAVFLLYNIHLAGDISLKEFAGVFIHGWRLDTSASSYLLGLLLVPYIIHEIMQVKASRFILHFIIFIIFFTYSAVCFAELEIYREWGTKINAKAMTFALNPLEVIHTAGHKLFFIGLIVSMSVAFVFSLALARFMPSGKSPHYQIIAFLVLMPGMLFIGMRGGVSAIPIHSGDASFSQNKFINDVATNTGWYLAFSIIKTQQVKKAKEFVFMDPDTAARIVDSLYYGCEKVRYDISYYSRKRTSVNNNDTVNKVMTTLPRLNILIIVMEGWSALAVSSYGNNTGLTPVFDTLAKNGLTFSQCYASASWTDQGIVAILSGVPPPPYGLSYTYHPEKVAKLPSLPAILSKYGYHTCFVFGGDLNYGNIRDYIYRIHFHTIIEKRNFPVDLPAGKLGIHDEFTFKHLPSLLDTLKKPFFAVFLTLSSHAPYDMPSPLHKVPDTTDDANYLNSIAYSDSTLGIFIRGAKTRPWFDSTIIFIIADHSHTTPWERDPTTPQYRKIPFLIYGKPLNHAYQGQRYNGIVSQIDLPAILLHILGIEESIPWSKNPLNHLCPQFAFYSTSDGCGWITPHGNIYLTPNSKRVELTSPQGDTSTLEKNIKAYVQRVVEYFQNL